MTTKEMKLLFAYDSWASNRLFDALGSLTQDQLTKDMRSSHQSIHDTFVHIVGSGKMWCSRWTGTTVESFLTPAEAPTLAALKQIWTKVGFDIAKFLAGATDKKLQDFFEMKTSKGDVHKHIYWQSMLHLVNHCSYHRGQIVTMMRQQDVVPPDTGMIAFFRETAKLGTPPG